MGCACRPFLLPQNRSAAATFSSSCGGRSCYLYPSLPPLRHLQPFPPSVFLRNASISYLSSPVPLKTPLILSHLPCFSGVAAGSGNGNNHGSGGGRGGGDGGWDPWDASHGDDCQNRHPFLVFLASAALGCLLLGSGFVNLGPPATALARLIPPREEEEGRKEGEEVVWEVKGSKWTKLVDDPTKDAFVVAESSPAFTFSGGIISENLWLQCRNLLAHLLLPEGFPHSVTSDYFDYSLWRGVQGVASQISGVLATQSLLFAVGLGKGAIPTAAALNWVLKDGIGYASKILLSKYGRHFDVNPKGWRLFADLLENAAFGLEMLTPAFPHLFVVIGAAAGAGRSAAALIQAATRSCFYAGFAAQRNFAEVIAKGEAQGMVSKSIGIMLAIPLANFVGSSTPLALISFGVVTWIHMFCNLKSYQCIQLRTLNPYRASLVFSEYLLSGQVPSVKEVNDVEPLFPALPFLNMTPISKVESAALSGEAKNAAAKIEQRLQLGCKLSDIATSKKEVLALFDLYRNEGYILIEHGEKFCVILKESSSPHDMLKSLFHVSYLYWLESHAGIKSKGTLDDCRPGGRMQTSLDYVQREFNHVKNDGELAGWVPDGLIARPLPNRIRPGYIASGAAR